MDSLARDVRHGCRRLAGTPGSTAVAALTLGLAISATTAIYSVVDALLLRPLPYRDPSGLQQLYHRHDTGDISPYLSYEKLLEWRGQPELFAAVEPFATRTLTMTGAGDPQTIFAVETGGGLMDMLGVPARLGRTIGPDDAQPGREGVVVLSDGLWRARFGGDPSAVGRRLRLDDRTFEVVGVMPPTFRFPRGRQQAWIPLPLVPLRNNRPASYSALIRLRPGVTADQAMQRADTIAEALTREKPIRFGWAIRLRALGGMNPGERYALYVLSGAVALVLLIACANLANLLLVQGARREREMAVRAALGASRARIVRHLLSETVLLALTGGVVGVALAYWGIELLAAFTPPALTFLNVNEIALERRVLGFAVILTALTAAGVGLVPALRGSRTVLHESLKAGTRAATAGPRQERVRRAFVVVQLAVSLVLLVGAGLLTRSFAHMTRIDPGFDARQLVTASLSLPRWKYPTAAAQQQFYADAVQRLRALPGVRSATLAGGAPPQGGGFSFGLQFDVEGRGIVLNDPDLILPFVEVQPEYFSVMGIPLRAGRTFSGEDTPTSPPSIVISEEMARQLWKGEPPVGRRIRMGPERPWYTVVGVVGDVYQLEHARPRGMFAVYYAMSQSRGIAVQQTLIVRTAGEPEGMIGAIKRQIWSVDPDQAILEIATLESQYAEFFATPRFYAFLMTAFAAFGLIVSAVGLYGVLAYAMAQRTREFGIRMALGARSRDVLGMVLRSGGVLTAAGMALGAAGSVAITRALESLLVDVPRTDPVTYAAVIAVLSAAAMAATWFPARRATRVDPIVALRQE